MCMYTYTRAISQRCGPSHMYNILHTRIIILYYVYIGVVYIESYTHSLQRSRCVLYLNLRGVKMANKKRDHINDFVTGV